MQDADEFYSPEKAGTYLAGTPESTLAYWRHLGKGPAYVKVGRRVFYKKAALDKFLAAGVRDPAAMEAA